jgi:hypothetical protein
MPWAGDERRYLRITPPTRSSSPFLKTTGRAVYPALHPT